MKDRSLLLLTSSAFLMLSVSLHAADPTLRVGVAKVDITPTNLTGLNMFGGDFKSVHDPIFARALVMNAGAETAALVALDLSETGDTTPLRKRIREKLKISIDHIIITASHDHNAPRFGSVTPGGLAHPQTKESLAFTETVSDKIITALTQAQESLQPAQFALATGRADVNIGRDQWIPERGWVNGYSPDGRSDKTVWVMKFISSEGQPIAILFNYAVHSAVTLGSGQLSGDLGGAAARFIEARYGGKLVALYTMGPAGDQNANVGTLDQKSGGPGGPAGPGTSAKIAQNSVPVDAFEVVNALGLILGAEVVRLANDISEYASTARIQATQKTVHCPVKRGVSQMGDMKQEQVSEMPLQLSLIMMSDVAITGVSGEVVTNIYSRLKEKSPLTKTMMVTIANDRAGYIADDAAYDTPLFEVRGTPFARGCAEPAIVNGLTELIQKSM